MAISKKNRQVPHYCLKVSKRLLKLFAHAMINNALATIANNIYPKQVLDHLKQVLDFTLNLLLK